MTNIEKMSLAELKELSEGVKKVISAFEKGDLKEAQIAAEKLTADFGITFSEIVDPGNRNHV